MKVIEQIQNTPLAQKLVALINKLLVKSIKIDLKEIVQLATFQSTHQSPQYQYRVNVLISIVISQSIVNLLLITYGFLGGFAGIFDDFANRALTLILLPSIVWFTNIRILQYIKQGKIQSASRIVVVISFIGVMLAAYYSGGLYSSAMLGLMVILVMATVLLDFKAMGLLYLLTILCFFLLLMFEITGLLPIVADKDLPFRMIALLSGATCLFLIISYHTYAIQQSERMLWELKIKTARYETERELTQNLTHDLRTPLAILKTTAYLIQKKHAKGIPVNDHLLKLDYYLNHMDMMLNDLMELTFLDSTSSTFFHEKVNLREIVKTCISSLEDYALQYKITIHLIDECDYDLYMHGNELQLKRLFNHLIENGIHYGNDDGYVKIILKNNQERIEILVEDNGVGIPSEYHERIFERFFRVDAARTTRKGLGMGIGLSTAKRIVELHHGSITLLQSELGKGSIFYISIPFAP